MSQYDHPVLHPIEQTRLLLIAALIATDVGVIQILPDSPKESLLTLIKLIFAISAASGFLYFLTTAAKLKHKRVNEVGNWPFTETFRQRCYDFCINSFGVQIVSLTMFGCAHLFGWNFNKDVWDWRVGVGALIALILAALNQYLVKYRLR